MLRITTVVLLLGAIANPQVPRLDLSAVADGDTVFYHGTVGKFEIRLTLLRGGQRFGILSICHPEHGTLLAESPSSKWKAENR